MTEEQFTTLVEKLDALVSVGEAIRMSLAALFFGVVWLYGGWFWKWATYVKNHKDPWVLFLAGTLALGASPALAAFPNACTSYMEVRVRGYWVDGGDAVWVDVAPYSPDFIIRDAGDFSFLDIENLSDGDWHSVPVGICGDCPGGPIALYLELARLESGGGEDPEYWRLEMRCSGVESHVDVPSARSDEMATSVWDPNAMFPFLTVCDCYCDGSNPDDLDCDGDEDDVDCDDDGDGTSDVNEDDDGDTVPNDEDEDDDDDGNLDNSPEEDDDGTGEPNCCDGDDDNDGTPDYLDCDWAGEPGGCCDRDDPLDTDGDGVDDGLDWDDDNDGVGDWDDLDDDGDGIPDTEEPGDGDGDGESDGVGGGGNPPPDSDGDDIPDDEDTDDDGDGIPDGDDSDPDGDGDDCDCGSESTDDDEDGFDESECDDAEQRHGLIEADDGDSCDGVPPCDEEHPEWPACLPCDEEHPEWPECLPCDEEHPDWPDCCIEDPEHPDYPGCIPCDEEHPDWPDCLPCEDNPEHPDYPDCDDEEPGDCVCCEALLDALGEIGDKLDHADEDAEAAQEWRENFVEVPGHGDYMDEAPENSDATTEGTADYVTESLVPTASAWGMPEPLDPGCCYLVNFELPAPRTDLEGEGATMYYFVSTCPLDNKEFYSSAGDVLDLLESFRVLVKALGVAWLGWKFFVRFKVLAFEVFG